MKLIVLSDLHLTLPGETLHGLDTHARLAAGVERIGTVHADADLVVIAGDLADRSRSAAYAALGRALEALPMPVALTLGNHDNRDVFARVLGEDRLAEGFAQSAHDVGEVRVIVLDTLERAPAGHGAWGHGWGVLDAVRLGWLDRHLDDRPTVIVMHHPAISPTERLARFNLLEPEPLLDRLEGRDVRAVVAAHVHRTSVIHERGVMHATLSGGHLTFGPGTGARDAGQMLVLEIEGGRTHLRFEDYVGGGEPAR